MQVLIHMHQNMHKNSWIRLNLRLFDILATLCVTLMKDMIQNCIYREKCVPLTRTTVAVC